MDPKNGNLKLRTMIKSHSDPNYQLRGVNGHRLDPQEKVAGDEQQQQSKACRRTLSLDPNGGEKEEEEPHSQRRPLPEVLTLSNMPKELGMAAGDKKSFLSFSSVGLMVESIYRLHSNVSEKHTDVERAVRMSDVASIRSLCAKDDASAAAAAFAAVREGDRADLLAHVMEVAKADPRCFEDDCGNGDGLLHAAVRAGAERCVTLLIGRGFDANQWSRGSAGGGRIGIAGGAGSGATPMHVAASTGQLEMLRQLASDASGSVDAGNGGGGGGGSASAGAEGSVLHAAIRANQVEVVRFLLEKKANKMGRGKFTETALHVASEMNHHRCAQLLLEDGILVDALRGSETRETSLHIAASNGYMETSRLLLRHSADPNAKNGRDETPLHLAARTLSEPVMRALIEQGADVNARDSDGRPPLHFAINSKLKGGADCMQILVDFGCDVNLGDANGTTALHLAALNRKLSRVKLLLQGGADLCVRNNAGKSALHFVMKYVPNSLKTIEERLDGGLQMENPDNEYDNTVKMNFNLLIPSQSYGYTSDVGLFTEILAMRNYDPARLEKILMHPLSLSFLHLKWQQVKWLYYFLILFSHLIYAITYSTYVVLVFNKLCRPQEEDLRNLSRLPQRLSLESTCHFDKASDKETTRDLAITTWIFLIIFNIIYLLKETTKFLHLRERYFKEWESVLNLLTIVSFPLISFHSNPFRSDDPSSPIVFYGWQFHAAGVGILITWILQMFLIGKVPRFGKYVQMLMNVGWSFFNFFVAYSSLIVGFSLAFVVLFPREVSFEEALAAPIKVMVMMTGEIEYNDLYYPQRRFMNLTTGEIQEETEPQFFPVTAHAILTIFILIVSIVIMNLLFGMAVSDVQELYKKSRLHQSIQQVQLISYMESILFSPLFFRLPVCIQKFLRRKLHGLEGRYRNVCEIEPDSYDENKLLPHYLNKTIKDKCNEMQQRREEQATLKALQCNMQQLEEQMRQINKTLLSRTKKGKVFSDDDDDDEDYEDDQRSHLRLDREDSDFVDCGSLTKSSSSSSKHDSRASSSSTPAAAASTTLAQIREIEDETSTENSSSSM